jgi:hypothetical protein
MAFIPRLLGPVAAETGEERRYEHLFASYVVPTAHASRARRKAARRDERPTKETAAQGGRS